MTMEGLDASDGAGTGTEIDEVRGGVWAGPGHELLSQAEASGGAGRVGTDLPALARALRGPEGAEGHLRPPPGPPLGAARAGGRAGAGAGVVRHPLLVTSRPSTSDEKLVADRAASSAGYNWLRLSLQAHGRRRAAPRRGAHRRKRPRRALIAGMMPCSGRLEPRVGPALDGGT